MEIDWITVTAQIVNFLILVWLLKRFLYQPVMRAMERREQRIAHRLSEAEERERQAEEQIQSYQARAEELERGRDELLTGAREEAERQKRQMLDEARREVAETRANWQYQVNQEKADFLNGLRRQAAEAITFIANKALSDLADAGLEERIVTVFLERLTSLDEEARNALADCREPVIIASAFELDAAVRRRLTRAIHESIGEGIDVEYTRSPELLCGIELTSGGQRLSWNVADYMASLTARVAEAFSPAEPEEYKDGES